MAVVKIVIAQHCAGAAAVIVAREVARFRIQRPVEPDPAQRAAGEILKDHPESPAVKFPDRRNPSCSLPAISSREATAARNFSRP